MAISKVHARITKAIERICQTGTRDSGYRFLSDDTPVSLPPTGSLYFADGGIALQSEELTASARPIVLFEVLTEESEAQNRGVKFEDYLAFPSLDAYVLIDSRRPRLEVFTRLAEDTWGCDSIKTERS